MAGESSNGSSPRRKRPRTELSVAKRGRPASGQRPPTGRSLQNDIQGQGSSSGQPPTNMRSFTDLVGSGRSRAELTLGDDAPDDAWATIANTLDNLGSASALPPTIDGNDETRSKSLHEAELGVIGETIRPGGNSRELTRDGLLLDLSLKKKIQVVSPSSLQWALIRSHGEEYEALQRLVCGQGDPSTDVSHSCHIVNGVSGLGRSARDLDENLSEEQIGNAKRQLCQALIHFRSPSGPLPAKIAADWRALTANYWRTSRQATPSNDAQKVTVNRLLDWQSSLQSLYYGYRYGHVPDFYVVLSTTTVLFNRGKPWKEIQDNGQCPKSEALTSSSSAPCLRACLAKASTGLRSLMSEYAVPFSKVEGTDGFEEPCVIVEGEFAVHTLYNFLSAVGHKISNATDVPILLADRPFRGSTIASAEVLNARRSLRPGKQGRGAQDHYSVQMRGLFTPRQISGICHALSVVQNRNFEALFEADPKGTMLNMCGHGTKEVFGDESDQEKYRLRGPVTVAKILASPSVGGFSFVTTDAN